MGATHPQNDERTKTKQSYRVENCEECNAINRHKGGTNREYDTTLNQFLRETVKK